MGYVNYDSIFNKIANCPRAHEKAAQMAERRFIVAKQELLEEFDNSKVTQEIQAGPELDGSKILPKGYGNLSSFLGFHDGREPIGPVRRKLENITMLKRPQVTKKYWIFKVYIPTKGELEKASPMDWESGRSWLNAVTKGLSGFSHYIFTLSRNIGRSGSAVQATGNSVKSSVRSGSEYFGGTSYVFGMLGRFARRITRTQ